MSGKAVLFNQDSVWFGFLGGAFFLLKHGQHLQKEGLKWLPNIFPDHLIANMMFTYFAQQSRPIMMSRKMRKKKVKPERA